MDPTTVVLILAGHLICTGGLFHLIGRQMPARSGVEPWSIGATLFGLAYLLRLGAGRLGVGPLYSPYVDLLLDATMVLSALLFLTGVREFVGRRPLRWPWLVGLVLVYALGHVLVQSLVAPVASTQGRYVMLNLVLGALYIVLAATAAAALSSQSRALRVPLGLLAVLMGSLGLATLLRGIYIGQAGADAVYQGLAAQVYYALATLVAVLLGMNLLWMVFVRLNGQLLELATRDALTRVLNRNGLDDAMARHFAAREPLPMTLLQIDIDHFKRVNDAFGHGVGDTMLRAVADTLKQRVRGNDVVARVGGEEFVVACVGGDMGVALSLGQRLRDGVAALRVPGPDGRAQISCTVSIGVSRSFRALPEREQAHRESDQALYAAKAGGRNQVKAFEQV